MPTPRSYNFWRWVLNFDMIAIVEPFEGNICGFFRDVNAFIGICGEYLGREETSASDGVLGHGFDLGFELHY